MIKKINISTLIINVIISLWLLFIPLGIIIAVLEIVIWLFLNRLENHFKQANSNKLGNALGVANMILQSIIIIIKLIFIYTLTTSIKK